MAGVSKHSDQAIEANVLVVGQNANDLSQNSTTNIANIEPKILYGDLPPLVSALKASSETNAVPFHFPGHKRGQSAPTSLTDLIGTKPFLHDITEHPELDRFSCPQGPLLEAKLLAADLFGAKETWFLVGGSTCGIQAAILACCSPGDTIVLPRNTHMSATTGMILCGALPKYIVPRYYADWGIAAGVTPLQVKLAIEESKAEGRKVGAVFITSPTYNGICSNLSEISNICHSQGIPLIVDEAHGAHFKFHPDMPKPALDQGADISIQSTHKVLCSLSQSSMLHISGREMVDRERLHKCLHSLQTTSPSWLLLASLDSARHQLSTNPDTIFNNVVKLANEAKTSIGNIPGFSVLDMSGFADFCDMDPLRITVSVRKLGLSGYQANEILVKRLGIVPELFSASSIALVFSLGTTADHVRRLVSGLMQLSASAHEVEKVLATGEVVAYDDSIPVMALSPRDAFFASKVTTRFKDCVGEVCGEIVSPFPPGIPALVPGEVITEKVLDYLQEIKRHGGYIVGPADPLLDSIVVCNKRDY